MSFFSGKPDCVNIYDAHLSDHVNTVEVWESEAKTKDESTKPSMNLVKALRVSIGDMGTSSDRKVSYFERCLAFFSRAILLCFNSHICAICSNWKKLVLHMCLTVQRA